ncbi:RagB/SusD family nutrient uptake outer membrane protein [Sphingobacterium pedocola]|uniref:RagB/SusD family nutrient uptake outer membrane protein n=1 Tax=Sphingobacterium pedocola TaxID=2082722 RepID=UPI0018C92E30|nr:RagB/SusD family nutrient uptake outer membrane protein [Sphingobacterium pedocola]
MILYGELSEINPDDIGQIDILKDASAAATMRIFGPFYNSAGIQSPDGKNAVDLYARNNSNYRANLDFGRAIGRGIGTIRPTPFAEHVLWVMNGIEHIEDLHHNSKVGNWGAMESIKYSTASTIYHGENLKLRHPTTNAILCAEAKFCLGDATGAAADVNEIRKRAKSSQLYTTVTIADIMNERARELYLEEWRHMELSRVSYCLALSGKPDEWGNTYDVNTYDKHSGTDLNGGCYWCKRVVKYGGMYNRGGINSNNRTLNYKMDKCNLYWPVPNAAITANLKGTLRQNYVYGGYNANTPAWDTWKEAVADEDKVQ